MHASQPQTDNLFVCLINFINSLRRTAITFSYRHLQKKSNRKSNQIVAIAIYLPARSWSKSEVARVTWPGVKRSRQESSL
jgi:hypothetical protein